MQYAGIVGIDASQRNHTVSLMGVGLPAIIAGVIYAHLPGSKGGRRERDREEGVLWHF